MAAPFDAFLFTAEDVAYLETLEIFTAEFLDSLHDFRFTGDVDGVPEGTVVFPPEPILRITAPLPQAQLVETLVMNQVNSRPCSPRRRHALSWPPAGGGRTSGTAVVAAPADRLGEPLPGARLRSPARRATRGNPPPPPGAGVTDCRGWAALLQS